MIANFNEFNQLEKPSLILTNPEEIPIKPIDDSYIKNYVFNPKFNDISEITFDIYEHNGNDGNIFEGYKKLFQRMRVSVSGYGSWIISQATEHKSNNGESNYKQVVLKSTEYELQDIQIPYIDGTYKFYDIANFSNSLMGIVLSKIPRWTISHVDSTISSLYRTFEVPDTNVLSFLLNDVQEAYGCIFVFDGVNRTINVYDRDAYVHYTGVVLTNDELIDTIEISRSDENLVTALSVYGSDDLGINAVNPLGTSTIYNFNQVKSWMSEALRAKVNSWEVEVSTAETTVKNLNISISSLNKELTSIETSITTAEQTLTGLKAERDVIISEGNQSSLTSINAEIVTAENNLSTLKANYDSKNNEITSKKNQLSSIQTSLSPSVYFGDLYNNFLSYVYEFEYTNDNIAVTDSMTYEERINEIQTLYDAAKDVLEQKVNIPNTYSVDAKSFVFNKKFLKHTHALQCGRLIGVETEGNNDGNIEYFPITEFEVNYEDKSLKLTFGNKFNSARAKDLFEDLMHDVRSTGKIVDYINSKKADSDQISDIQKFINSSLDLSKNAILSADGQSVEINDSGYHGRKINVDGSLNSKEVAIINNCIAFTEDNWNTCSLALGEITLDNGNSTYGLVAETLVGKFILGENLKIINASGSYTIDDNGFVANSLNSGCQVSITPNDSNKLFSMSKDNVDVMRFDSTGNIFLKGGIYATSLTITNDAMDADTKDIITGVVMITANKAIEMAVSNSENTLNAKITQTADSITSSVSQTYETKTDANNTKTSLQSQITQNATSISSKVSKDSIVSEINQSAEEVKISANKITLDGMVVANATLTAPILNGAVMNGGAISIGNNNVIMNEAGMWIIGSGSAENPKFRVDNSGNMTLGGTAYMTNSVAITGALNVSGDMNATGQLSASNINATGGKIGNWSIGSGAIANNGVVLGSDGSLTLAGETNVIKLGSNSQLMPSALYVNQGGYKGTVPWWGVYKAAASAVTSDERVKQDITILSDNSYETLFDSLVAYTFRFKKESGLKTDKTHIGFIAQKIKENIDDIGLSNLAVYDDDNPNLLGVDKQELIALCVWQIQKLKARVAELERK